MSSSTFVFRYGSCTFDDVITTPIRLDFQARCTTGVVSEMEINANEKMKRGHCCDCHDYYNITQELITKCCRDICDDWKNLNDQQKQFIDLINRIVTDHTLFESAPEDHPEGSLFHLYNKRNRSVVVFLKGMGGTGKTETLRYMQKHLESENVFHYINLKHILLFDFYRTVCKRHSEYNDAFPSNTNRKTRISTIAKICKGLNGPFNEDTAYVDFSNKLSILRKQCISDIAKKPKCEKEIYLCVVDEFSTISPTLFVIITKLIREISTKTVFIFCGDDQQCKPIENNKLTMAVHQSAQQYPECQSIENSVYLSSSTIEKDAFPRDLVAVAKLLFSSHRVYEHTLTNLIRSAEDENLQRLITLMCADSQQSVYERRRIIKDFIKKFNISTDRIIDVSDIIDKYINLIIALENADQNDETYKCLLKKFCMPFKIIAVSNATCNEIDNNFARALHVIISRKFDAKTVNKYIAHYSVGTSFKQYLIVGFSYKMNQNLMKNDNGSFSLPNGKTVQLISITQDNNMIKNVVIRDEVDDKLYVMYPSMYTTNCRLKNNRDKPIVHTGFPIQFNLTENAFQCQGLTIPFDVYLDCYQTNKEHLYVMMTRFQKLTQLKSIINLE